MTEGEVFQEYLDRGFDDVMPFADYLAARSAAVKIMAESDAR